MNLIERNKLLHYNAKWSERIFETIIPNFTREQVGSGRYVQLYAEYNVSSTSMACPPHCCQLLRFVHPIAAPVQMYYPPTIEKSQMIESSENL